MSSVVISGNTSGAITVSAPAVAGTNTITLAAQTGTLNVAGPAFSAYQTGSHALTTSTNTKVQFQAEDFDTASCFDSTTNYRFTPNVAGYYQINSKITVGTAAPGLQLQIYKNGSAYKTGWGFQNAATTSVVNGIVYLNGSTDYIEIWAYNFTTATSTSTGASITWVDGYLVRGA